jgi:adenylate kinase
VVRTVPQAEGVTALLSEKGRKINFALFFDVSDTEILGRLAKRRTLEHRADDDPKAVATRLEAYRAQTAPVLDWYRQNGALHTIQAVGSVQEIADRVREVLGK